MMMCGIGLFMLMLVFVMKMLIYLALVSQVHQISLWFLVLGLK